MNVYNIKMDNLTYTKGYYGASPENLSAMMQKMYHDGKVCLIAWSYLDKDIQAEHILRDSAHYKMKCNWEQFFEREMWKLYNK